MRAVITYMRITDFALRDLAEGLQARGIDVSLVLCHSGEREVERAATVWPDAMFATHRVRFSTLRAADATLLDGLSADVLAQALPIAERSISPLEDVNVSHLVQVVASQYRRAHELVSKAKPSLGLFVAQPERLLDFFVHLILKEAGIPCVYPRVGPISGLMNFSLSRDAPLLASNDRLAPETIRVRGIDASSIEFRRYPTRGTNIREVISPTQAVKRWSRSVATRARVRFWLGLKGQGVQSPADRRRGSVVSYHLHLEPEATTYPANGFRSNQLNNIALLSEWVGGSGQVLVKEHPVMLTRPTSLPYAVRNRNRAFYEAIRRLPNVVLLNRSGVARHRVNDSNVVATVGGNVGWEALSAGVPVVHFGQAGYENAVGAHRWTGHLRVEDVLERDRSEIADASRGTIRLLAQYAFDERRPNRRVGRVRGLLAALDATPSGLGSAACAVK